MHGPDVPNFQAAAAAFVSAACVEDCESPTTMTTSTATGSARETETEAEAISLLRQDEQLDTISASLARQHELSLQMNEELDLHHELLQDLDGTAERTGLRIGGASDRLETLRHSLKDHGMLSLFPSYRLEGRF